MRPSPKRDAIAAVLQSSPDGISARALGQMFGIASCTARWHLLILRGQGLAACTSTNSSVAVWCTPENRSRAAAANKGWTPVNDTTLMRIILDRPQGITSKDLAATVGCENNAVRWRLHELRNVDLAVCTSPRGGPLARWCTPANLEAALEAVEGARRPKRQRASRAKAAIAARQESIARGDPLPPVPAVVRDAAGRWQRPKAIHRVRWVFDLAEAA